MRVSRLLPPLPAPDSEPEPDRAPPPPPRALPRTNLVQKEEPPSTGGFAHRIWSLFRRHDRPVAAVIAGASAIPGIFAPGVAHAEPAPVSTTPVSAPIEELPALRDPAAVRLAGSTLFPGLNLDLPGLTLDLRPPEPGPRRLLPTTLRMRGDGVGMGLSTDGRPRHAPVRSTGDPPLDALLVGVPASVQDQPWTASFDDYVRARAALGEVPTALAGMALKPVANHLYEIVDRIPAPIRRPFDRSLGILLDNAVSVPANLMTAHVFMDGGALPGSASIDLPSYGQMRNSCGETMVATWLKGNGYPIALGEVDTQLSFFEGGNLLEDAELRNRGFSIISGPSSFNDLRTYLAHGYPVMVNVGWENGGGHYAVATGYDDKTGTIQIDNWEANGKKISVPYGEFKEAWARHKNLITVVHPQADARLSQLRSAGKLSRTAQIQEGVSLSDVWVTQRLEFYVEGAFRYRGTNDDFTLRLNTLTPAPGSGDRAAFGGAASWAHRFGDGTEVNIYAERLPLRSVEPETIDSILRTSSIYAGVRSGPVAFRAGYERGGFQARLQAELNRRLYSVGAEARVSVTPEGTLSVFVGAAGTF